MWRQKKEEEQARRRKGREKKEIFASSMERNAEVLGTDAPVSTPAEKKI